jgi:uncharacterized protein
VASELASYDLNIHGLEDRTYVYSVSSGDVFFGEFDQEIIKGGSVDAEIELIKNTHLLRLNFKIKARLKLECDRSLDIFEEDFSISESYVYKFGDHEEELSEEMSMITFGTPKINVAQHVFDFVFLAVPMRRIKPELRTEDGDEDKLFYEDPIEEETKNEQEIDPRWADLLKIKNKN